MSQPFDPYNVQFGGVKLDPYRIIDLFQIEHPAIQQALKKLLRCGAKHKSAEADVAEAITSLERFQQMKAEEIRLKDHPELFDDDTNATMFETSELLRDQYRTDFQG